MGFTCGIVGLPNVGKSSLFNALTKAGAESSNYPFCTIEPNVGTVPVPDHRFDDLIKLINPKSVVPALMEFTDIAGLVKGASQGEGLGNQFLNHISGVQAIVHVVRCFESDTITHVSDTVDPLRDMETIATELAIKDLDTVTRSIKKMEKFAKVDKKAKEELDVLKQIESRLNENYLFIELTALSEQEMEIANRFQLLSFIPRMIVANIGEADVADPHKNGYFSTLTKAVAKDNILTIPLSANLEDELAQLEPTDMKEFMSDLGINEPGLNLLIRSGYELLSLMSFFTAGEKEVRAWTIPNKCRAPQAAGKIHSDFEKGFIRAEVIAFAEYMKAEGSLGKLRESGLLRQEGKEYFVNDADIINFKFNV